MKLRATAWAIVATPVAVLVAIGTPSCSSSSKTPEGLAQGCSINTDCNDPLICAFSLCHEQCAASRDCSGGEACVKINGNGVCQLPSEAPCSATKACETGLVCGQDSQCRAPCMTVSDCLAGQLCTAMVCYDPGELDGSTGTEGGSSSGGEAGGSSGGDASPEGSVVVEAGPLGYVPSNLGTVTIASGQILTLNGANPVIIAALGPVDIQGSVNVNGVYASLYPGAGGWPPADNNGAAPQGPGAGGNGLSPTYPTSGAGGGSYCGTGGKGAGTGLIAPGGGTYGNAQLIPLLAGSAGGYADNTSYSSFSGGAVQISSATSIIVRTVGFINAGGAGALGGGGSGGAILLEAPTVTIDGTLAANGGGGGSYSAGVGAGATPSNTAAAGIGNGGGGSAGTTINGTAGQLGDAGINAYGGGGGGAGFIRINTGPGGAVLDAGTISPALSSSCMTQGMLAQ